MFLSDLSIKRPVLITMALLVFVLFGVLAYFTLPLSFIPDVKIPYIFIQTVYAGSGPLVIEAQVTKKIEDEIASLGDIDEITSYSMESVSIISVKFKIGKNEDIALQEVKDKVDRIVNDLPEEAEKPTAQKLDMNSLVPILNIVMEGDLPPAELYTLADKIVKGSISQVPGVGRVDIVGGQEREIRVEFDKATVFEDSLSLPQIALILKAANLQMPGGSFKQPGQDIPVRLQGEFESLEELENIDIPTQSGIKRLRQLAEVRDTGKTVRLRTTLFDKAADLKSDNALLLQVIKVPSGNIVQTVRAVEKKLPEIEKELGNGIALKVATEQGSFIQSSVNDTLGNILQGVIFTAFVLLFFLHDLRSTFIIAIAMPFSIISTFMIMKLMGISLNLLSLMGLSTSTGILVSNSVVVLENIFRHKELGHNRVDSAAKGTSEVFVAVIASTLTNIAVFLPLGSAAGFIGIVLRDFAYTVVIATVFSIIVSFTLTPMLASRILPESVRKELWISRKLEALFKAWERGYKRLLEIIMHNKKRSLLVVFATLVMFAGAMILFGSFSIELSPNIDGGDIDITVELPQGYDLEETARTIAEIENRVREYPEVKTQVTTIGQISSLDQGVNMAKMQIKLTDKTERDRSNLILAADITKKLSDIPNASIRVDAVNSFISASGEEPVSFYIQGRDMNTLEPLAKELTARMQQVHGFMNINTSSRPEKPEIVMKPDRIKVAEEGITIQALALTLRAAVEGLVTTKYKEEGNEYDIRVVMKDKALLSYEDLRKIPVATPKGARPLSFFADIQFAQSYNKVMHVDKISTIKVSSSLLPGFTQGDAMAAINKIAKTVDFPTGYRIAFGGFTEMMKEMINDMIMVFFLAVILTYMLLAATLESFVQPLLILATIPLSFIGIVCSLLVTGTTMSMVSMLAIVMLVGIVVNNAILMLDYTNKLRKSGMSTKAALLEACPTKLKPILMANIATILGLLPMALGLGAWGAEMRQPMGIVSIGGLISSTVFTLLLIPAMQYLLGRKSAKSPQEARA